MKELLRRIRACHLCPDLPLGPRPILQASCRARLLIAGQAPGRITHARGRPFDDASGDRLRGWLGLDRAGFYDANRLAIVPMGFCYPGKGRGGDLPPRPECATAWRDRLLAGMPAIRLTLVIGRYAEDWHLSPRKGGSLAERVRAQDMTRRTILLPHPSPRNNLWLRRNPWFEAETIPVLRRRVADILASGGSSEPGPP